MEREDRLKQLTDQLTDGVKAVRDSGEYKKLLAVMAKFPHYSMNNCMLLQCRDLMLHRPEWLCGDRLEEDQQEVVLFRRQKGWCHEDRLDPG